MVHKKKNPAFLKFSKNQYYLMSFLIVIFFVVVVVFLHCGEFNYFSLGTGGALYHQYEPGNYYNPYSSRARKCLRVLRRSKG